MPTFYDQEVADSEQPLPIAHGGLFRCCLDWYDAFAQPAEECSEGDIMTCGACGSKMIVRNGTWRWKPPIGENIVV